MAESDTTTGAMPGSGATPGQAGPTTTQAGATPPAQHTTASSATGDEGLGDAGKLTLRKERERAEAAEARLKALEEKDLPEAERTKRRLAEIEAAHATWTTERQDLRTQIAAIRMSAQLGFRDPDDALGWLALNRSKIEFDASGDPSNLSPLLRDLLSKKPHLGGRGSATAEGGARGQGPALDMNSTIRQMAGRRP